MASVENWIKTNSLSLLLTLKSVQSAVPGLGVAALIAASAFLLSVQIHISAVFPSLVIGIAFSRFMADSRFAPGIAFGAKDLMRLGVGLLGVKVGFGQLAMLGWQAVVVALGGLIVALLGGTLAGRFFGLRTSHALIASGGVAICGASASLAIAAVLPPETELETETAGAIAIITLMGTVAMAVYPLMAVMAGMTPRQTGIFLGASLHEVAQVAGAGYSVSDSVGVIATAVKLLRVACLAPVVFLIGMAFARRGNVVRSDRKPSLFPWFLILFVCLSLLSALQLIPAHVDVLVGAASQWCLLVAIAALGMKISFKHLLITGLRPLFTICAATGMIAVVAFYGARAF